MKKLPFLLSTTLGCLFHLTLAGQVLKPSISNHTDWSHAGKLEFVYENIHEATDTQALSMVFHSPDSKGFQWECTRPGNWYDVEIIDIQEREGKRVVTHEYNLEDTTYLIDYVAQVGIIGIAKNGVHYRLKSINDVPFVLATASPLAELPRKPFIR